jgi:Tol biopolymer transport system component
MGRSHWERLQEIFERAQACSRQERESLVASACAGDEALHADVLSLLESGDGARDFLATPAFDQLAREFAADGRSLRPGERVGAYIVDRLVGSGGGGEVWRARDERLDRDVAIKVLPPQFISDAARLRRFADEARSAGALNHPNILVVHDVGEHRGTPFLVTEYLNGQSLRHRLASGPLSVEEAVGAALGIARGLAAAHGRGIVHRDLKPDNVFLSEEGGVKLLDFGLATLHAADGPPGSTPDSGIASVMAGTVGYMPPEQINGRAADARGDLFALGVTLYELLSGRRPFAGASTLEILQAVLTAEPAGVATLNAQVSPQLAAIVARLLKRAPDQRFQSAADVAWALEQVAQPDAVLMARRQVVGDARPATRRPWLMAAMAVILTGIALPAGWFILAGPTRTDAAVPLMRFSLAMPAGTALDSAPSVAPDGLRVAFAGRKDGVSRLFVRELASPTPVVVSGTEGARHPFWSPDSRSLGFFARGKLMTVLVAGGAPMPIADAREGRGGAWSGSGIIVFAPDILESALLKVPAGGGPVEPATLLDRERGDNSHRWPVFLPDEVHFLYFSRSSEDERRGVYVARADRPASVPASMLIRSDSEVSLVADASPDEALLLSSANGHIEVRRFDATRRTLSGDPRVLAFAAAGPDAVFPSMLSASADTLAFVTSPMPLGLRVSTVLRSGKDLQVSTEVASQNWPRLSPDGRALARQRIDVLRGTPDIWVDDLERGVQLRVTTSLEADMLPVWSPDGTRLAYVTTDSPPRTPGRMNLVISARDGTGVVHTIPCPDVYCETTDWTPDGRSLIVNVRGANGGDVWAVPVEPGTRAYPLLHESYVERDARVSPNGRWVSYVTEENGRPEIAVRTIEGSVSRTVISGAGGDQPVWRRDGAELFFVNPQGRLCSAPVRVGRDGAPAFGIETPLDVPPVGFGHFGTQYDVTPDGTRIYFLTPTNAPRPTEIEIVRGWRALLGRR